jgi:hypothetical protein
MSYTFDGVNKVITLGTGVITMSVRDVYSRWIDWFISASGNQKYLPAFLTVGGDVIDAAAGTSIPIYGFLVNGWRIRPQEADHTLTVTDGILLVSGGGDPFLNTLGSHVVRVNYQQPVQAITAGGGGNSYTLEQIADAVWSSTNRTLTQQVASPGDVIAAVFAK